MKRKLAAFVGIATLALAGCSGEAGPTPTVTVTETVTAEPSETPAQTPEPEPEPSEPEDGIPRFEIGETGELLGMVVTIESAEVMDTIPSSEGSPLKAKGGEQLVLIKGQFKNNSKNLVNLCGPSFPEVYVMAWDTEEREMDPLFEDYKIEGNNMCGDALLQGQSSPWAFAYRSVKGAEPSHLALIETANGENGIVFYLN